jgi:peroxiredoxin
LDDVLVAVRLALAAIFVVAAIGKLTDREGARTAALALGVPAPIAALVPIGLPLVELLLAAGLLRASTAPWAGGALAVVLVAFVALVSINLIKGRRPTCHCFGTLDSAPISPWTIVRNVVLLAAAASVALAGHRQGADVFGGGPWVDVVAFVGLIALAVGVTRARPEEAEPDPAADPGLVLNAVPVGDPAPDFVLADVDGDDVSLTSLLSGGLPVVVVFGTLRCPSCLSLMPDVEAWQREFADVLVVVYVVSGHPDDARDAAERYGIEHVLVQKGQAVTDLFGVLIPPSAVVIEPDGTMGSLPAIGPDDIRELVDDLTGRPVTPFEPSDDTRGLLHGAEPLAIGAPAPEFRLPSSWGPAIGQHDLRSGALAFVFVQRQCSQCSELLDKLSVRQDLGRRAVVVSTGPELPVEPEAGFGCPVLADELGFLPAAHGITAFPSAVIVDDNVVASSPAVGTDAVIELLGRVRDIDPIDVEEITEDFVPRPNPQVASVALDGVTVVGDPNIGTFCKLDGQGRLLWSCFDGTESLGAIAADISAEFGAPLEVVRSDVLDFARQLGRSGALDGIRPTRPAASDDEQGAAAVDEQGAAAVDATG